MNILHINTNPSGGAANACIRIHVALVKAGYKSRLLVLEDLPAGVPEVYSFKDFEIKRIGKTGFLIKKYLNKVLNKLPFILKPVAFFNKPTSLYDVSEHPLFREADIVNFHWVVKFVDYTKVFRNKNKQFVWTMHDMAPFSGGYHYLVDFPYKAYKSCIDSYEKVKFNAIRDASLSIIYPSVWLGSVSEKSKVFGTFKHIHVPYAINTDIFSPQDKVQARKELGLPQDKKIVLFVADKLNDKRKGFIYIVEAVKRLSENTQLLVMGASFQPVDNMSIHNMGYVNNPDKIAKVYSAADVFVIPSIEDNLPNTVIEALSCGTPVVGFNIGGIPDMIDHKQNGYLVSSISAEALAEGINYVLDNPDNIDFAANARAKAVREYSESIIAEKIIGLYNSILNDKN